MSELTLEVTGMSCGHCVIAVTQAVGELAEVSAVQIDLVSGHARVRGIDLDPARVHRAVVEAGYGTADVSATSVPFGMVPEPGETR